MQTQLRDKQLQIIAVEERVTIHKKEAQKLHKQVCLKQVPVHNGRA